MFKRLCLCAAFAAVPVLATQSASAAERVKVGSLRCEVSAGLGMIIASKKDMTCVFTAPHGRHERYSGTIGKFGLDIGATNRGVLAWDVFAPTGGPEKGALAGRYVGVGASVTLGAGLGANALIGGNKRTIALQPLSVQAQTGLNLAGGVSGMTLHYHGR